MKHKRMEPRGEGTDVGTAERRGHAFGQALSGDRRPMLGQAAEMLGSGILEERLRARGMLLNLAVNDGSDNAKELLQADCRRAIASSTIEERVHARSILGRLAARKECPGAKKVLELDRLQAIADFDFDALVFLGMNCGEQIGREADAALERDFERIAGGRRLDTLAYIAAISGCSIAIRRKAAEVVAEYEQRKGNLVVIHDATEDCDIKNRMKEALHRLGE